MVLGSCKEGEPSIGMGIEVENLFLTVLLINS